jgi:hypothetical protein
MYVDLHRITRRVNTKDSIPISAMNVLTLSVQKSIDVDSRLHAQNPKFRKGLVWRHKYQCCQDNDL